jgi:hypothetical protein
MQEREMHHQIVRVRKEQREHEKQQQALAKLNEKVRNNQLPFGFDPQKISLLNASFQSMPKNGRYSFSPQSTLQLKRTQEGKGKHGKENLLMILVVLFFFPLQVQSDQAQQKR